MNTILRFFGISSRRSRSTSIKRTRSTVGRVSSWVRNLFKTAVKKGKRALLAAKEKVKKAYAFCKTKLKAAMGYLATKVKKVVKAAASVKWVKTYVTPVYTALRTRGEHFLEAAMFSTGAVVTAIGLMTAVVTAPLFTGLAISAAGLLLYAVKQRMDDMSDETRIRMQTSRDKVFKVLGNAMEAVGPVAFISAFIVPFLGFPAQVLLGLGLALQVSAEARSQKLQHNERPLLALVS